MAEARQRSLILQSLLARVVPSLDSALAAHPAFSQAGYSFSTTPAPESRINSIVSELSASSQSDAGTKEHQLLQEVVGNQLKSLLVRCLKDAVGTSNAAARGGVEGELTKEDLHSIFATLDLGTICLRCGLCVPIAPLDNIEELLEMLPIPACVQIWAYVEDRADELIENLEPGKGKGLVLLRLCNDLLRRLSKPTRLHSRLAGRVLSLLAYVFPLGERSGTNFRGDFNIDNVTKFDEDWSDSQVAAAEGPGSEVLIKAQSPEFYKLFWNLQSFFSNPALLFQEVPDRYRPPVVKVSKEKEKEETEESATDPADADLASTPSVMGFVVFKRNLAMVLDVVQAIGKRENELAGAAKAEEEAEGSTGALKLEEVREGASTAALESDSIDRPRKRKQSDESEEGSDKRVKTGEQDHDTEQFFPKFLTGRKVFEYELRDPFFRKHILLQSLIILQFMLGLVPQRRKDNWPTVKNKTLISKLTSMCGGLDDQHFSDEESAWVKQTWKRILALITDASPDGQTFQLTVLQALRHEPTWLRWKDENCPPIYRPPIEEAARLAARTKIKKLVTPLEPFRYLMGTEALMELWTGGLEVRKSDQKVNSSDFKNRRDMEVDAEETEEDSSPFAEERRRDGFRDLENDLHIPTLGRYRQRIKAVEMRVQMRRKQLTNQAAASAVAAAAAVKPTTADESKATQSTTDSNPTEALKAEAVSLTPAEPNFGSDSQLGSLAEAKYSLTWRALRLARSTHLHLFPKLNIRSPDSIEQILEAEKNEKEVAERRARGEEEPGVVGIKLDEPAPVLQPDEQANNKGSEDETQDMPPPATPAAASSAAPAPTQSQPQTQATTETVSKSTPTAQVEDNVSSSQAGNMRASEVEADEEGAEEGDEGFVVVGEGIQSGPSSPQPDDGANEKGEQRTAGDGDEEMTLL